MAKVLAAAFALLVAACASAPSVAQTAPAPSAAPPDWWAAHVAFISRDGGTWVSPNPPGVGDPNAPDAFAMEWRAVNDGRGLVGRLYGIEAGREIAEYWTFREFWHPGERRAILEQWGGPGAYGVGESRWENDEGILEQTFWLPDGRSWREGHRNREEGDVYHTHAFDIDAQGNWTSQDPRIWTRAPAPEA
ncbi:MAG: hypothetical protein R3C25_14490 [Hyphomonadaceae bacterium]